MNFRTQAQQAMIRLCAQNLPLPDDFNQWPSQSKNLVLQACRYYHQLAVIANHLSTRTIKDPEIWTAIILALTELKCLESPEHAVIHEWVQIVKSKHTYASGFVNAILRRFKREQAQIDQKLANNLEYQYSHPLWFINEVRKAWPMDWSQILIENNVHPPMTLRINRKLHSPDTFLQASGLAATPGDYAPTSIRLAKPQIVTEIMGFNQGWCSVQDEAAQLAAFLLDLKPGQRVLDACAAPGGKTAHILETEPNLEYCLALESDPLRYQRLLTTLKRLNIQAQCLNQDASIIENFQNYPLFERILIDAPCSGTGVIRRHPDIKLRRRSQDLRINLEIQEKLLTKLWQVLAPGGLLLYATCSILPEENDLQIQKFIAQHAEASIEPQAILAGTPTPYGQQIFPGQHQMDGFYYALIRKNQA